MNILTLHSKTLFKENTKLSSLYNTKILFSVKPRRKNETLKKVPKRLLRLKKKRKNYIKYLQFYYKYKASYQKLVGFNLKNKLKLNAGTLRTEEKKFCDLYKTLKKPQTLKYGIVRVFYRKRNIFLVLSDYFGKTYASTSYGTLTQKKKKYKPAYIVKDTARKLISKLFMLRLKQFHKLVFIFKGRQHRKTKNALLEPFQKHRKLNVLSIMNMSFRSHNGCRPRKIRRK